MQAKLNFERLSRAQLHEVSEMVRRLYAEDQDLGTAENFDFARTFDEFERFPHKGLVVAIACNGALVGYAILVYYWSNEYGGDFAEIDELYILPEYRSKGIGKAFFGWVEDTIPCVALGLQVSKSNLRAAALYKSIGFDLSPNHHMLKRVRSPLRQAREIDAR